MSIKLPLTCIYRHMDENFDNTSEGKLSYGLVDYYLCVAADTRLRINIEVTTHHKLQLSKHHESDLICFGAWLGVF